MGSSERNPGRSAKVYGLWAGLERKSRAREHGRTRGGLVLARDHGVHTHRQPDSRCAILCRSVKKLGIPSSMEFNLHFTEQLCAAELKLQHEVHPYAETGEVRVASVVQREAGIVASLFCSCTSTTSRLRGLRIT